jgi:Na+/melibiose symporter-like transporter
MLSSSGYIPGKAVQSESALLMFRVGYFLPVVFFLLSGASLMLFPIQGKKEEEIKNELNKLKLKLE